MPVTPMYAAALGLVFFALSVRTILARRRLKVAVGDGQDPAMLRAMRVHSNFAEYVPITLLLMFFAEQLGTDTWQIHALGTALLAGRLIHAIGVSRANEDYRLRVTGMALTFTALLSSAGAVARAYL
ncbi:MAG: MAPEG family protein [Pseudomonadota bacterium]